MSRPGQDEWEKLWDEEVAETEDDVMALAVSFLLVQACLCTTGRSDVGAAYQVLRFGISGQLPNSEAREHSSHCLSQKTARRRWWLLQGEDEEGTQHSTRECARNQASPTFASFFRTQEGRSERSRTEGMLLLAAAAFGCFEILKITFRSPLRASEDGSVLITGKTMSGFDSSTAAEEVVAVPC